MWFEIASRAEKSTKTCENVIILWLNKSEKQAEVGKRPLANWPISFTEKLTRKMLNFAIELWLKPFYLEKWRKRRRLINF